MLLSVRRDTVVKQDMYTEYGLYRSLKYICMEVQGRCKYIKMDFVESHVEKRALAQ